MNAKEARQKALEVNTNAVNSQYDRINNKNNLVMKILDKIINTFNKRKKRTYAVSWKHSLNNEIVIYPSEKGWEKINSMFSEEYVDKRTTEDGGYKDLLWAVIEDLHELFYHGTRYLETTSIEIIDKW